MDGDCFFSTLKKPLYSNLRFTDSTVFSVCHTPACPSNVTHWQGSFIDVRRTNQNG